MSQFPLLTSCQNLITKKGDVPTDVLPSKLGNLPNDQIIMNYLVLVRALYTQNVRRFKDGQWSPTGVKSVHLENRTITFVDDSEISAEGLPIGPDMMQVYIRACLQVGVYDPPVEFFLLCHKGQEKTLAKRRASAFVEYLLRRDWKPNEHSTNSSQCVRNDIIFRRISLGKGKVEPASVGNRNTREELVKQVGEPSFDIADYRIVGNRFFQAAAADPIVELKRLLQKDNFDRPAVEAFTENEFLVSWFRASLGNSFNDDTHKCVHRVTQSKTRYFQTMETENTPVCGLLALLQSYHNLVLPTARFFRSGDDALEEEPFGVLKGFGQQHKFNHQELKTVVDTNGFTIVKNQLGKSFGEPLGKVDFRMLTFTYTNARIEYEPFPEQPSLGSSSMHTGSSLQGELPYDFLLEHGVTLFNESGDTLQLLNTYRSYVFANIPFNKSNIYANEGTENTFFEKYFEIIVNVLTTYGVNIDKQLQFEPFTDSFINFKHTFFIQGDSLSEYSLSMFYRTVWWNNQVCKLRSLFFYAAWVGDRCHDLYAWLYPEDVAKRNHYFITPLCSVFLLEDLRTHPSKVYGPLYNVLYEIPYKEYGLEKYIDKIKEYAKKKDGASEEEELVKIAALFHVQHKPLPDEELAYLKKIVHPAFLKYLLQCFPAEYIKKMKVEHLLLGAFALSHPTHPTWYNGQTFEGVWKTRTIMDNISALQYIIDNDNVFERNPDLYPMMFNAVKLYHELLSDPYTQYSLAYIMTSDEERTTDRLSAITFEEAFQNQHDVVLNPFHAYTYVDKETAFLDQVTRNIELLHNTSVEGRRVHFESPELYVYILDPDREHKSVDEGHPYAEKQDWLSQRGFIASTKQAEAEFAKDTFWPYKSIAIPVPEDLYMEHFSQHKKTVPWSVLLKSSSIINLYNERRPQIHNWQGFFEASSANGVLELPSFRGTRTIHFSHGPPPKVAQKDTVYINCDVLQDFDSCELFAEELYTDSLLKTQADAGIDVIGNGNVGNYMAAVFAARAYEYVKSVVLTDPVPSFSWREENPFLGDEQSSEKYSITDRLHEYISGRETLKLENGVLVEIFVPFPPAVEESPSQSPPFQWSVLHTAFRSLNQSAVSKKDVFFNWVTKLNSNSRLRGRVKLSQFQQEPYREDRVG